MFDNTFRNFGVVVLCIAAVAFSSCAGAGPTPLGGTTPVAAVSISISPTTTTLAPGSQQAFTAAVNNANNTAVGWLVNGIVGGNSTFGTIDNNGNYAAPLFVPTPPAVTVTAVAQADSTKTASASANISGTPVPVTLTISPTASSGSTLTAYTAQTLLFTASVTGAADTSVNWELNGQPASSANSSFGTLVPLQASQDEAVFTAPAQVPAGKEVTITAVSSEYPSVTASSTVTISKPPTVTGVYISPTSSSIFEGESVLFTATVGGTAGASVTWKVDGVGSIVAGPNNTATYTAPATVATTSNAYVIATSTSDSSLSAEASITVSIPPPNAVVAISPTSATVYFGQSTVFTATVSGASDTSVSWLLNGNEPTDISSNLGTLVPIVGTNQATYTGPFQVPGEPITITAVSNANSTKAASATVTVIPPVGDAVVTVSPNTATLFSASPPQVFSATVTGVTNSSVSWQVDGNPGGSPTVGTIQAGANNTATYTPPAQVAASFSVTVTAVSNAQPSASGSATVNLEPGSPPQITVTVSPSAANVVVNGIQAYTAQVTNAQNQTVTWQVNHVTGGNINTTGSIDVNGNYTAPAAVPNPATVEIEAISNQDNKTTGTATATIGTAPVIQVTLAPLSASVQANLGQEFTATVTGTSDPAVSFAVNGEVGGDSTIGTISWSLPVENVTTATYLAPATVPTPAQVQVTAISAANGTTTSPAATVTITAAPLPIQVSLAPTNPTLIVGQSQIFNATVTNTTNYGVSWGLSGQNCSGLTCGTIVDNGTDPASATYTAPQTVPTPNNTVTVTASANADPSSQATATVTVEPNMTPSIAILPASATLQAGSSTFDFSAVIQNAPADTEVTWTLGCISLYDGDPGHACFYLDDGPGCLTMPGGFKKCGAYAQSALGNEPVTYTPPESLFTTAFQQNACQTTNQGIAQVPLTAAMTVNDTLYTTVPPVCITITPP
ncbi:MAG TPA: hypothetical protein VEG68_11535 [Terriglobales bacterium]|nr:hypothetical protein [Terriglobales bacterium]